MKWLTVLFTVFILLVIFWANTGSMPRFIQATYRFSYGDKVGHFLLFGILSFLVNWTAAATLRAWKPARTILTVSLLLFLLVGFEEWTQAFIPARTFSLVDLAFSYAGLSLGAWIAWRRSM